MSKSNYYIDPAALSAAVVESLQLSCFTEELGAMVLTIADKVLNFPRFRGYSQDIKDEIKSYALYRLVKTGLLNMDPTRNLFAYITQACYLNMLTQLTSIFVKMNRHNKMILDKLKQLQIDFLSNSLDAAILYYQEQDNENN